VEGVRGRGVTLAVFAALAVSLLPSGAAQAQQSNSNYCAALYVQARRNLSDRFADYISASRTSESSFRSQILRAREAHDAALLRKSYRAAKRLENREALAAPIVLGQIHERYRQDAAAAAGCDPNALVGQHGSYVAQVGVNHVRRLHRLRKIYRHAARVLRS
jgi:hypothetical protein